MNILLLEEQPLFREVLVDILQKRIGHVEVESTTTVAEAQAALGRRPSQLVLVDFGSGDVCGSNGLEGVVEAAGGALVATSDARAIPAHARRAKLAGARAYIPKTSTRELMDAAFSVVLAGGSYFPDLNPTRSPERPAASARLSPRQEVVMGLLDRGLRNQEIAHALGISVATVKLHVHGILKATGARSRTELMARSLQSARPSAGRDHAGPVSVPPQLLERSRGFMFVLAGPEMEYQFANPTYLRLIGKQDVVGKRLLDVLPDIEPVYLDMIACVRRTRQVFVGHGMRRTLYEDGVPRTLFIDLIADPLLAEDGSVSAVLIQGCDVTDKVGAESGAALQA